MLRHFLKAASVAALTFAPCFAHGQEAQAAATEHFEIVNGHILVKQTPDQPWADKGWGEGATLRNAARALQFLYPEITVAVDPRVADLPLTDIIIRAEDPSTDLEALRTASGDRFDVTGGQADPTGKGLLYSLRRNSATDVDPTKTESRDIECFNLTGYLEHITKAQEAKASTSGGPSPSPQAMDESVSRLQAIINETIAGFDGSINPPQFQFYREAQLLIVTGSKRALVIAAKIIHALPGQQAVFGSILPGDDLRNRQIMLQLQADNPADPNARINPAGTITPPATATKP